MHFTICRRHAALHGVSGATRSKTKCPQRHGTNMHRSITRASPNFTARNGVGVGEDAAKIVFLGLSDWKTGHSETANAPTPPMSAPGGLARRFWGTALANGMPATSSRNQSPSNELVRHRTLRRAMASASAKMP